MSVATTSQSSSDWREVNLTYDFELEPRLALAWLGELVARPLVEISPAEYVSLLSCHRDLSLACPDARTDRLPPQLPSRGRALIQAAMREASQRNLKWMQVEESSARYASRLGQRASDAWDRLPEEISDSSFESESQAKSGSRSTTFARASLRLSCSSLW